MVEETQTNQNPHDSDAGQNNRIPPYLRGVFIAGAWGVISLLLTAVFWPNLTERMKFFTTTLWIVVTTFAVIAQAVINRRQWDVMRRQLHSASIGERAYIGIEDMQLTEPKPLAANVPLVVNSLFKNGGKTPAWRFRSHYRAVVSTQPIAAVVKQYPVQRQAGTGAFIVAGQTKSVRCPLEFRLSDEQVRNITVNKTHKLFILTEVTFRDYLNEPCESSIRAVFDPGTHTFDEADYDDDAENNNREPN